ncbi:hypothetical protein DJ017_17510 [Phenylobacterium soli]|uniref:Helix-turn-helix domain-containing protein n=1 Tax=Phenylobacterium soli TaxID=2170551 RepID=A0A328AA82_9CAUL|nr:hypothetical protein DJ017_17510 [Phenylobacterium soli]
MLVQARGAVPRRRSAGTGKPPSTPTRGREAVSSVISRQEAADYLGISTDTLDRLRASGRLPALQVSARLIRYRKRDLDEYLNACQTSLSSKSEPHQTGTSSGSRVDVRTASRRGHEAMMKHRRSLQRSA